MLGCHAGAVSVYSDASDWGFGATHSDDCVVGPFAGKEEDLAAEVGHHYAECDQIDGDSHINLKEMWAVVAAACRWVATWENKCRICHR